MIYFIPAWYQQNQWCENEQIWYVRRMHTEFDDTVKQVQLFHRSGLFPYRLLLLSFTPNLRHFLHRQGVSHAFYWSCFDAIQEIRRKKPVPLSFHKLNWPPGIEFIYTPWAVTAWRKGEKYAQIEFGEDGNPILVSIYEDGSLHRRNIYDDRGFLSASMVYKEGKPFCQDYFMENGIWKMRCFQEDGHVEMNPGYPDYLLCCQGKEERGQFSRCTYESMDQVIYEVFQAYLDMTGESDIFCAAMHERHVELLQEVLKGRKQILSFFSERYPSGNAKTDLNLIKRSAYVIADSEENLEKIQKDIQMEIKHMRHIPPYDTRADAGISRQLPVQKILVPTDGVPERILEKLVQILGKYLFTHKDLQVHLFTRKADTARKQQLLKLTEQYLTEAGYEECFTSFFVEQCVGELAVTTCMKEQRIVVDLTDQPELYLQITAVSIGIPQIVRTKTEFVQHGKNGIVLRKVKDLYGALCWYLESLENWNQAQISAYELGKKYTADQLMKAWKEVMDSIG